ncbi:MAG: DUF805 domain-containing protein [Flavobacteriales bacterium]|nr:DUF805 domain-containing protein [Flavobacteriales bacterium]
MEINDITRVSGQIGRRDYIIWGIALFALKYNLDRLLAMASGRKWFVTEYWGQFDPASRSFQSYDIQFYVLLLLLSLPFIWFGTALTLKRLRSAALPGWLVVAFFLPFINILFFAVLSAVPERISSDGNLAKRSKFLPASKMGSALAAVGITGGIAMGLTALLIDLMGEYGWSIFVGIPFVSGFAAVIIFGNNRQISLSEAISVALASLAICCALLFLIAFEGIICLVMAFPIGMLLAAMGAVLGYFLVRKRPVSTLQVCTAPLLVLVLLSNEEHQNTEAPPMLQVVTSIEVDANKSEVWTELVAFSAIDEPKDWLFKTGIAYPTHSEISGTGVGAIRECNFTTGPFVEPITVWDEPNRLAFSVLDQPPPMVEWSFGDQLDATHLDGYFQSHKGEFKLTTLPNGRTLLTGTTWYTNDIWPVGYWKLWTDFILHRIHLRVLNHIKNEAEVGVGE